MFSLMPRCQALCGSAKYTFTPILGELGVSRHFLALFAGHRQALLAVDSVQPVGDPLKRRFGRPILQFGGDHEQGGPLDQGTDRGGMPGKIDGRAPAARGHRCWAPEGLNLHRPGS